MEIAAEREADVVIVSVGITGTAIAIELSRYTVDSDKEITVTVRG